MGNFINIGIQTKLLTLTILKIHLHTSEHSNASTNFKNYGAISVFLPGQLIKSPIGCLPSVIYGCAILFIVYISVK